MLKTATNDKVLCNINRDDNHVKTIRQGQLSKGGDFDCEIDKQLKNEKTLDPCVLNKTVKQESKI